MKERINYISSGKLIQIKFIASATAASKKATGTIRGEQQKWPARVSGRKDLKRTRTEGEESEGRNEGQTWLEKKKEEKKKRESTTVSSPARACGPSC